jgi:hypothetical protein
VPVPADYEGTGMAEIAVYRRSTGEWFVRRPSRTSMRIPWGAGSGDAPAPADYDGDGITDIAVYRAATGLWLIRRSTDAGLTQIPWGAPALGDAPVSGR